MVTAKAKGYAYIYAEATDGSGEYARCYVNVTEDILVSSISLNYSSYTLNANGSVRLRETVCPTEATNKCVTWSSNKPNIAFVNPDSGFVTAQSAGTARIRATATDGSGKYAECTITVNPPIPVTDIDICPTSLTMNVGDVEYLCKTITPSNATNQSVTWCSSDESVASVGIHSGRITAKRAGKTTITATTVDGGYQDCTLLSVFETYISTLENLFGFSTNEARLIRMLYDKVDTIFTSESIVSRAWKCARLLSMFNYDGLFWNNLADSVVSLENAEEYFVNTLGYTTSQYNIIKNAVTQQHGDTSTPDFSHMQYALAARLTYYLVETGEWSHKIDIITNETLSYMGGWVGDATLKENDGTTSMANDDYCADLDAENVYRLIINGNTSVTAMNSYYSNLTSSRTRADVFLQYIGYSTVKEKVFYELIDMQLSLLMSNASEQGNFDLVQ